MLAQIDLAKSWTGLFDSVGSPTLWLSFLVVVCILLALDLGVLNRTPKRVTVKEAAVWSVIWVALSLCFNVFVWTSFGRERGLEFLSAYLIEKSLSVEVMERGGTAGELSIEGVYADVPNYVDVVAPGEDLDFGSYQIELHRERIPADVTRIELYFTFSDGSVRPLHLHLEAPGEREEAFTPALYRFDSASRMKPLQRQDRPGLITPGIWALEADVTTTLFTDLDGDRDGCELGEVCAVVHGTINEHGSNSLTLPDRLVDRISETPGRSVAMKVWIQ